MATSSPEKGLLATGSTAETGSSVVLQPGKVEGLAMFLEEINKISEVSASGPGEQWSGGGGGTTAGQTQGDDTTVSARDLAIATIPLAPVMQKELEKHIRVEVKKLRKQAMTVARMGKPGAAYNLNQIYSRIRHLNALMAEILEASYEVLKRLFIRVFIDKQPIM